MNHSERVARIADEIKQRARDRAFLSIGKGQVSHMVPSPRDPRHRDQKVNVRDLDQILHLDPDRRVCTAESGVPFCELVTQTMRHGLLPKLVPELKTITLGGAVAGCSVESMSYKYGGFHDSCTEYEVVTGTGAVLRCSRQERADLFEMMHGAYGTLGILTELTFDLIPAKPYVHMEYRKSTEFPHFHEALLAACKQPDVDFVDGIIHGPGELVLCIGRFVDRAPWTSTYDLDIYYKSTRERSEDYLATSEYLFRYDRECHWLTRTLPGLELRLVRRLLGRWLLGSTNLLSWSARLRPLMKLQRRPPVVVDVFVPNRRFPEFHQWYERTLSYYPLWIVPYSVPRPYPWLSPAHVSRMQDDLFIDCAVYGMPNDRPDVDYSQLLEQEVYSLGGIKTLISQNHHDEAGFWSVYNRQSYEAVKRQTDPDNLFRDLYQKFHYAR